MPTKPKGDCSQCCYQGPIGKDRPASCERHRLDGGLHALPQDWQELMGDGMQCNIFRCRRPQKCRGAAT
jgi:hypothetical protein